MNNDAERLHHGRLEPPKFQEFRGLMLLIAAITQSTPAWLPPRLS